MKKIVPAFLLALLVLLPQAARSMSFEDERKLAREVVTSLDAQGLLVEDQEVAGPVRMLSEKLADHVGKPIYAFNVHVINDRTVNAFTIPDGHIFVNVGTLLFARDLDELAAVIGHEMAHAQLRHIPQAYEQQSQITAASILGVVLGALAASKNPQAGAALIFSSLGGGENFKLAYTRRHELDADDFGRKLLESSGYDETAMDRFLSRLGGITGGKNFPEYLLTHPTSTNRLSGLSPDAKKPRPDGYYWTLQTGVAGVLLPPEEGTQRVQAMPEPYRRLALAMIETNRGRSADALTLLAGRPRLVVTRTMSKAFALAGARLGYLAADPSVTDALRLVRMPYHLGTQTQAVALAALTHTDLMLATVGAIKAERDRIVAALTGLGLQPVPSDANFVLFGHLDDAPATWRALLDRGVLVRDVGIPHYLRVTAGTPEETTGFLDALAEVLAHERASSHRPTKEPA